MPFYIRSEKEEDKMGDNLIQIGITCTNGVEQKSISNNMGNNYIKIGLTNPKILFVSYLDLDCSNIPIGIATVSAILKKAGFSVTVMDFEVIKKKMESEGKDVSVGIEDFDVSDFDVVCFSLIAGKCLSFCLYHIDRIKLSTNKTVMAGGPLIDSMPERVLKESKVDFICVGEGENTITNYMDALKEKNQEEFYQKLNSIPGLGYRHNGKIVINQQGELADMDKLPIPDYEALEMETYLEYRNATFGDRTISLYSARGCPFSCQFCYHTFGKKWRAQSAIKIVEHIKYLKEHYNIKTVFFRDEVFMFSRERTSEFCKLVKPLNIKWECQSRCTDMDEEIVTEMKEAGCVALKMGLESGSNRMLKEMRKAHTLEQSWKAIRIFKKVGMQVIAGFMVGMPNETIKDAKETLKFIRGIYKLCPDAAYLRIYNYTPRPNTPWYNRDAQEGMKELSLEDMCDIDKFHNSSFNSSSMTDKQIKTIILKGNLYRMYYEDFLKRGGLKRLIMFITKPVNIKKMIKRLVVEVTPS